MLQFDSVDGAPTGGGVTDMWLAGAVLDIGLPRFHLSLLRGLRDEVGADHISHVTYDAQGRIRGAAAASLSAQSVIDGTTDLYVNRLYERDPNYGMVCAAARHCGVGAPSVQMITVQPTLIADAEYRRLLFEAPGFGSKVSLISTWAERICYFNLYFSDNRARLDTINALLRSRGATLMALTHAHERLVSATPPSPVDAQLQALSSRERQVLELLQAGHTIKEVGRQLGLSPTTVVTYKNRLYEKLGVSNLKQLLTRHTH